MNRKIKTGSRPDKDCPTIQGRRASEIPEKRKCSHCRGVFVPMSRWNYYCYSCQLILDGPNTKDSAYYCGGYDIEELDGC
jgi:hypothetical protein